jgi:hypothetical protein
MLLQSFPAAPALPLPSSSDYPNELNNVLRLYFNQLSQRLQAVTGGSGGQYLQTVYGAFENTATQTLTANTATAMVWNQTDYANGTSLSSSSHLNVTATGIYNLQFSTQFQNADNQLHDASIWLRVNGTDVTGSTGLVSIPNSHGGTPGHTIAAWNFFLSLAKDDYIQIYCSVDSAQVTIQAYAAGTSPTRPTTASNVVTLTFVSTVK